jgi:hypothetical protein
MIIFNQEHMAGAGVDLVMMQLLARNHNECCEYFTTHRWLMEDAVKRMIYWYMYCDILNSSKRLKILDVGGGVCSITCKMAMTHDYTLVDIMDHDGIDEDLFFAYNHFVSQMIDWYDFNLEDDYDIVVANDLFPNVDQRLELFIEKFLPRCKALRLSLTYYNEPRFYRVERCDANELLTVLAWDGEQLTRVLSKYVTEDLSELARDTRKSLFKNGRQVCMIELAGGLSGDK